MFVSDFKTKNMFNIYLRPFQPFPRLWFSDPIQSQLLVSDRCSCEIVFRLQPTFLSLETTLNVKHFQECQALIKTFKLEKTDRDQEKQRCTNRSPLPNTGHRTAASSGLDFLLHIHRRSRPLLTLTAWKMKPGISGDMMTSHMSSTGRRTGSGSFRCYLRTRVRHRRLNTHTPTSRWTVCVSKRERK